MYYCVNLFSIRIQNFYYSAKLIKFLMKVFWTYAWITRVKLTICNDLICSIQIIEIIKNYKKAKFNEIIKHFESINWDAVLEPLDANSGYEYFLKEYYKTCESYVPLRKLRKSNDPLWMNKNLKDRIKEKSLV